MKNNYNISDTKIICENDKNYPSLLKKINKPPKVIFAKGNIELLNKPSIAIVGSRNYTEYGKRMAKRFSNGLTREGFAIVSGMALGIDRFAHEECINSGGKTIAVLGCGFNNIYPKENKDLFEAILQTGGCIITEYSPDVEAKKENFPNRNRLISGLCLGTLVVEANYRSGTSITARFCIEQNRKLFCIPNSIESKNSIGTNNLIKKGGNLVISVKDIIEQIGEIHDKVEIQENSCKMQEISLSGNEFKIYKYLKEKPNSTDEIANYMGLTVAQVNCFLSLLEIEGYIIKFAPDSYKVKECE